ncbi:MAG: hypothetical protein MZW92_51230 [Comamonadaceae bacterium]|nr:hypothetical protein [Comamonadaceae bacterium]
MKVIGAHEPLAVFRTPQDPCRAPVVRVAVAGRAFAVLTSAACTTSRSAGRTVTAAGSFPADPDADEPPRYRVGTGAARPGRLRRAAQTGAAR